MNRNIIRMLLFACIVWLVPFVTAMFFYSRSGELKIDIFLFKAIMHLESALVGTWLMLIHLRKSAPLMAPLKFGLISGLVWLMINWALDFLILLPLNGQDPATYFMRIGLGYLAMPITGFFIGYALQAGRDAREGGSQLVHDR